MKREMSKRRQKLRPAVKVEGDIISPRFEWRFDILYDGAQHERIAGRQAGTRITAKRTEHRLVLQMLKDGQPVPTHDALQLRNWAIDPEDALLTLAESALRILRQEENQTPRSAEFGNTIWHGPRAKRNRSAA
jgi:hypothetical protein